MPEREKRVISLASVVSRTPDDMGLECRKCGCKEFKTYKTRPAHNYVVQRVRICKECGNRIKTWERECGTL